MKQKLDIRQVAIIRIIRSGHGLGRCMKTLDEVFIPKSMVDQFNLKLNATCFIEVIHTPKDEIQRLEGSGKLHSEYKAKVIYDKSSPFIHLMDQFSVKGLAGLGELAPQKNVNVIDWDEAILAVLQSEQEFFTSFEVMEQVERKYDAIGSNKDITSKLTGLHMKGKIAKLSLTVDGKQDKVSKLAWCDRRIAMDIYKKYVFGYGDEDDKALHTVQ